jgi:hypothetical protein
MQEPLIKRFLGDLSDNAHTLMAIAELLIEKGVITREEIEAKEQVVHDKLQQMAALLKNPELNPEGKAGLTEPAPVQGEVLVEETHDENVGGLIQVVRD